MTILQTR